VDAVRRSRLLSAVVISRFVVATAFLVSFPAAVTAARGNDRAVVISEIMFNPDGDENAREFVELVNISAGDISLDGWLIGDGEGYDRIVPVDGGSWLVPAGSFALVLDPDYFTSEAPYDIPRDVPLFTVEDRAIGSRGLSNSTPETVSVVSASGDTVSAATYDTGCPAGHSWERIVPRGADDAANFAPSREKNGTPGARNSVTPPAVNPALDGGSLSFFPADPRMGDRVEVEVRYRNAGLDALSGDVQIAVLMLPDTPLGAVTIMGTTDPGSYSAAGTVTVDTLPGGLLGIEAVIGSPFPESAASDDTVRVELAVTVPEGAVTLNEIMAAPSDGGPEWVELFNAADAPIDLYGWSVRDEAEGRGAVIDGHVFVPARGYAVIAGGVPGADAPSGVPVVLPGGFPQLNNGGDTVVLADFTGASADSMRYDSAPAGVSLERISTGDAGVSGWSACTDPAGMTPGRVNSVAFDPGRPGGGVRLTVDPNPFLEETTIACELPFPLARVSLSVYDRRGRLVATLRDAEESGSSWTVTWDGRSGGSRLPAGPYILVLEALDKRSGRMVGERKTVVVASRL